MSDVSDTAPDKWTTERVLAFLKQNGLEAISAVFQENEVTGKCARQSIDWASL